MEIPDDVARFIGGPVLMTLATRDARNRPMIARGSGGRTLPAADLVEVAVSAFLWPETVANIEANGTLAATFVDPASYRAYQLKGRATVRQADRDDRARADAYVARAAAILMDLGVAPEPIRYWLTAREVVIASLTVDRIFEQTPGPRAGTVVT